MKKSNQLLVFISFILAFISCTENENNPFVVTVTTDNTVIDIGKIHNEGLNFIFDQVQSRGLEGASLRSTSVTHISSVELIMMTQNYLQKVPEFSAKITDAEIKSQSIKIDEIRANFTPVGIQEEWTSTVNSNLFKSINLSSTERKVVADIEQVFMDLSNSNLSTTKQYQYIKTSVANIKSAYEKSLSANNQSELLYGLLNIVDSSSDYWYNLSLSTAQPQDPIPFDSPIIQVDAMGYLIGWILAYSDDNQRFNTQAEFSANSSERIDRGLRGAITASGIRAVVKYG
jgi:hypothetical protein